jgi:hypothetical protein
VTSTGFLPRLWTVLALRLHLYHRRLASRGLLTRLAGYAGPFAGLVVLAFVGNTVRTITAEVPPEMVAAGAVGVMAAAHLMIFLEVVARVGRGEGMAAALYHFPLSPSLIHAAEMLTGSLSPGLLLSAVVLLGASLALAASPLLALPWMILGVVYLAGLRQMLQLALATLLRRRWLREVALALVSMAGIAMWLGFNYLGTRMQGTDIVGWVEQAPRAFWLLPFAWFVAPFAEIPLDLGIRITGLLGGPLLIVAVFVIGFDLQDAACYGESPTLLSARGPRRHRRRWHLADRRPLVWIPPAVWATADKEIRVVRRDPFLMVMLMSQGLILLAPAFLFPAVRSGGAGAAYLPVFCLLLLMAEHTPLFNLIGLEGRGLHFLAQTPVSRWHVMMGKNLAYVGIFGVLDALFLAVACVVFGATDDYLFLLMLTGSGLVILLGLGNFVSAFLPMPWAGARAAAGGSRSAAVAAEGGVERPGCGTLLVRMFLLQLLPLLGLPVIGAMYVARWFLPVSGWLPVVAAVAAWSALIYVIGTASAVSRLDRAEEKLLALVAGRAAQ